MDTEKIKKILMEVWKAGNNSDYTESDKELPLIWLEIKAKEIAELAK